MNDRTPAQPLHTLEKARTRRGFERAAGTYDAAAVLQREVGSRLLERLDYMRLAPQRILDLGCGTGFVTERLLARYKQAEVIGLDLAPAMVARTRTRGRWLRHPLGVCADVMQLPFQPACMDLMLSNLMLQWVNDLPAALHECVQALRPGGLILFSTFGPDTLKELRTSWSQVDGFTHVSRFTDLHDVGDALLAAGFRDPVVDMEMMTLTYTQVRELLQDLKGIGANNATAGRNRGLTGRQRLQAFYQAYEQFRQPDGRYPATYEVIYGHAWAPEIRTQGRPERFVPVHPVRSQGSR